MEENKPPTAEDTSEDIPATENIETNDLLRRRRITGVTIYGLSVILAFAFLMQRNAPLHTFFDAMAWIVLLIALSFLIWLIPMALIARSTESSSKRGGSLSTTRK